MAFKILSCIYVFINACLCTLPLQISFAWLPVLAFPSLAPAGGSLILTLEELMMSDIKVHVHNRPDRKNYSMRYLDVGTGKHVEKTTGTTKKTEAIRRAAVWEADIMAGRSCNATRMNWDDFRMRFYSDYLEEKGQTTITSYESALNVFERATRPKKAADLSAPKVSAFKRAMRANDNSPATIHRHLNHLKVICNWAVREKLLPSMPSFTMPKLPKGMRGRPITLEEFERMIEVAADIVGSEAGDSWRFYLKGLWTSGLRLEESLKLRWDDGPEAIVVDYSRKRPLFRIDAEAEKGKTHRLLPMAPEFAILLEEVPIDQRNGWVFRPLTVMGNPVARSRHAVGPRVSKIGEKARVITDRRTKHEEVVISYAGAHDLRRSFGFKWSRLLMPAELKELMRHADISTTMKFYVGVNADATADKLWEVLGDVLGDVSDTQVSRHSKTA
jgi:integrase